MTDYSPSEAERDAFLDAVTAVFAEHRPVSSQYGIASLARLSQLFGREAGQAVGVGRDETGRLVLDPADGVPVPAADVADFSASVIDPFGAPINPMTGEPEGACIIIVPDFTVDPPGRSCITYLTS
jgi:hypothetical protein